MIDATLTSSVTEAVASLRANKASVNYSGTFSAGTVKLQIRPNGESTFSDLVGTSFSSETNFIVDLSPNWELKAVITGADGSDSVNVNVDPV